MSLYLCVDCGGSKTSTAIADSTGKIIARGSGGPSNRAYLGDLAFISAVEVSVTAALSVLSIHISSSPFAAAWLGVSGVDSVADTLSITPLLSKLLGIPAGPRLMVANDTHLLAAPVSLHSDVQTAVAVVAGTGSICVGFQSGKSGRLTELGRVGGCGWILGDEGGGFHVGREALRQIILAHDLRSISGASPPASPLTQRVLKRFGVEEIPEILALVHYPDPNPSETAADATAPMHLRLAREKRLSSLSPLVFRAAFSDADPLALNILKTCAGELAGQILHFLAGGNSPGKIVATDSILTLGGSLAGLENYRNLILEALEEKGHVFRYVEWVEDPAGVGAASLAAMDFDNTSNL